MKLQLRRLMKCHVHALVRRLMQLSSLEAQLAKLKYDGKEAIGIVELIESQRDKIPVGVLLGHDRKRRQGRLSVAEVCHGVCAGCHLALGIGNVAAVRRGELRSCGNCGRYLYSMEDESQTGAACSSATAGPSLATANPGSSNQRR